MFSIMDSIDVPPQPHNYQEMSSSELIGKLKTIILQQQTRIACLQKQLDSYLQHQNQHFKLISFQLKLYETAFNRILQCSSHAGSCSQWQQYPQGATAVLTSMNERQIERSLAQKCQYIENILQSQYSKLTQLENTNLQTATWRSLASQREKKMTDFARQFELFMLRSEEIEQNLLQEVQRLKAIIKLNNKHG